jgi:hypothetical protein
MVSLDFLHTICETTPRRQPTTAPTTTRWKNEIGRRKTEREGRRGYGFIITERERKKVGAFFVDLFYYFILLTKVLVYLQRVLPTTHLHHGPGDYGSNSNRHHQ